MAKKPNNQAPVTSQPVQPKRLLVREVVPWFIVTILTFSVAGIVTGWFIHSSVVGTVPNVTVELKDSAQ